MATSGRRRDPLRRFQGPRRFPSSAASITTSPTSVCEEFAEVVRKVRSEGSGHVGHFLDLERRLFLELTMTSMLDVRSGSFNSHNEEVDALIEASNMSNSSIFHTDYGLQLWRIMNTPMYRRLVKGQNTIYRIALKYVERRDDETRHEGQKRKANGDESGLCPVSVLDHFLLESTLEDHDIVGLVCDGLLAGIDTGAYTLSYTLYCLATNPDKQDMLAKEAKRLLSKSGGKVTTEVLREARYLKAVLKETYRLFPISIGVGRLLQEDTILAGYRIPKDTVVVSQNQVSCRLPEHFPEPTHFLPERWLHKAPPAHPFLVLPFGHGPRSCIGRRMAEQNLQTALLQLLSQYRVGWNGGDLDCVSNLINEPDEPLNFTFTDRE